MKNISCFLFIIFSLCTTYTSAQTSKNIFSDDLKFYKDSLPVKHKNLFAKLSKPEFNAMITHLEAQTAGISAEKFYVEIMKIQAAIGDEHSTIIPPYTTKYPVKFERFDDGLVVTSTDEANKQLLLSKVIRIGDKTLSEAEKAVSPVIISGNIPYFNVAEASYLASPGLLYALNLSPSPNELKLELLSPTGETLKVKLNAIPKTKQVDMVYAPVYGSLLANTHKENYWYLIEKGSLYFNYNKCEDDPKKPFEAFNDNLFKEIEKQKPNRIIIDLRMNGGGNSAVLEPFIEKIKNHVLNKKGKIFVLIGRATFSSAIMNAIKLKKETKAILVGETTAGTINHYGEVRAFNLPNTKLQVNYSTQYWENWKGHDGPLVPDVKIEKNLSDLLKGNDKTLNYVMGN
ncbi:S41 family peptidase [Pedobacter sp. SG918]|uniref:S41 family peptidase n=1 Tax=Pedobacter sp. SG918 TaxID=2587136 RepID=UPI001469E0B3|nr:S41 family peptidase [Pedobacter sp. SG918]NMN37037.1 hypothetical protein [Pedobacter sp. SG918]